MSEHWPNYQRNFADNEITVRCCCGWNATARYEDDAVQLFGTHLAEQKAKPAPVVQLVSGGLSDKAEAAEYLTNLAARVGKGEIEGISVVFYDRENYAYERFGSWEDRWKMYAALEYAKAGIDRAD